MRFTIYVLDSWNFDEQSSSFNEFSIIVLEIFYFFFSIFNKKKYIFYF